MPPAVWLRTLTAKFLFKTGLERRNETMDSTLSCLEVLAVPCCYSEVFRPCLTVIIHVCRCQRLKTVLAIIGILASDRIESGKLACLVKAHYRNY